jgi:predicted dehydrogenase
MSKDSKIIKVGVVGLGGIAQVAHIPILKKMPDVEIVAVCDIEGDRAAVIADRYKIPKSFENVEDMLELHDLDAVHICVPNNLHMPVAITALSNGKHVLVERPMAVSVEQAEKMVESAKKNKRKLMVAMNQRFRPDAMILRNFVTGQELGEIFYCKAGWLRKRTDWTNKSWQVNPKISGGGVIMDLGVSMMDLGLWLMGNPKPESVVASTYNHATKKGIEDSAAVFIKTQNGGTLTVEVSWSLLMEKDFLYTNLFGTKGGALLNPLRIHKEMHENLVNVTPTHTDTVENMYKKSYEYEIKHFIECIKNNREPISSGEEGLERIKLIEAIYKSAKMGKEVKI